MKFTIVYDNDAMPEYRKSWGFSCLIGTNVLFDTGADLETLLYNMNKLQIDFGAIDTIVLSHEHGDHTGGIDIVHQLGDLRVFIPQSFSRGIKRRLSKLQNVKIVEVRNPTQVVSGITSTGEIGTTKEQSLMVETPSGLVIVTGCSHPGLHNIMRGAVRFGKVYGVLGGFHGFDKLEILSDLRLIVPCHCTRHKRAILLRYPDTSKPCGVGCVFEIP